jgi:integrase
MKNKDELLNDKCVSIPAATAAGGKHQEWNEFITSVSQNIEYLNPYGMGMGELEYVKKFNRLNCPITLDPKTSTFEDVRLNAFLRQRLDPSTIEKRLRYARFMENHIVPVDFRNPNYANFIRHMDYREQEENATSQALRHEWKTMTMFLKAYGIADNWVKYRAPHYTPNSDIVIPYPEIVNKFFSYDYSEDPYETKLYQYLFFAGFTIGMRPPSELANLDLDDITIDGERGSITITETKKHGKRRTLIPERFILISPNKKSLKNYIDKWRPKVDTGNETALFLTPRGKRFTPDYLRGRLSLHGNKIWNGFHPYTMRHWCATARMIEWDYNIDRVGSWLGHSHVDMTRRYVHMAEEYYKQDQGSWLNRAIRSTSKTEVRCKHDDALNNRYMVKKGSIDQILSCKRQRAWRDVGGRSPVKKIGRLPFLVLSIFLAIKSISLNRGFKSRTFFGTGGGCYC